VTWFVLLEKLGLTPVDRLGFRLSTEFRNNGT
jgi:hypothetical protein